MTVAAFVFISGLLVSMLGIRFDGALDMHLSPGLVPWTLAVLDSMNAILVAAVLFWITSRIVAQHGRILDFILSVTIARIPLLLVAVLSHALLPPPGKLIEMVIARSTATPILILVAVLTLPAMIWFITMLYQGFRLSSGLHGAKSGIAFTVALVLAEVVSKFILVIAQRHV